MIALENMLKIASECIGIPLEAINSTCRKNELVIARYMYYYFSRETFNNAFSFSAIGSELYNSNNDHTTVIHGIKTIKNLIETKDKKYYPYISLMEKMVKQTDFSKKLIDAEVKIERILIEEMSSSELHAMIIILRKKLKKVKNLIKEKRNDKQCEEAA